MTPIRAARFARRLRSDARTARLAGEFGRAATLYSFAARAQALALVSDFGGQR